MLLLITSPLRAQWVRTGGDSWVNTEYNTTEGTEFWATFMRNSGGDETDASSMTLYLYATARKNAIVTVENPNTAYTDTFHVAAGKQRTFKVPNEQAYIQLPNVSSNIGLRITSTTPIPANMMLQTYFRLSHWKESTESKRIWWISMLRNLQLFRLRINT